MKNFFLTVFISSSLLGVNVSPLDITKEPGQAMIEINRPLDRANIIASPIKIEMDVQGVLLGTVSQVDKKNRFRGDPKGQTIHLFIDNNPYITVSTTYASPYLDQNKGVSQRVEYELKQSLPRGQHLIRALLCRSFGESLKGETSFTYCLFNVSDRKDKIPLEFDKEAPLLTYNEPQGTFEKGPILLDFYLSNCTLSPKGYKVSLVIDNKPIKMIDAWVPYAITGLSKGPHKVRLTLIDQFGGDVSGEFNIIEREIFVK